MSKLIIWLVTISIVLLLYSFRSLYLFIKRQEVLAIGLFYKLLLYCIIIIIPFVLQSYNRIGKIVFIEYTIIILCITIWTLDSIARARMIKDKRTIKTVFDNNILKFYIMLWVYWIYNKMNILQRGFLIFLSVSYVVITGILCYYALKKE